MRRKKLVARKTVQPKTEPDKYWCSVEDIRRMLIEREQWWKGVQYGLAVAVGECISAGEIKLARSIAITIECGRLDRETFLLLSNAFKSQGDFRTAALLKKDRDSFQ